MVAPVVPSRSRGGRIVAAVLGLGALALVVALVAMQLAPPPPVPPRLAVVKSDGSLSVIDVNGAPVADLGGGRGMGYGPPAWSPDGTHVAAIGGDTTGAAIRVFDLAGAAGAGAAGSAAAATQPLSRVVYQSADRAPFYLSWSPDGSRVGFLATEGETITLRTAFADGSAASDGAAGDGILRTGNPMYFTWQGGDRLLLHVGLGDEAFTGPVDLAGTELAASLDGTGDFQAAVASPDGSALAYVRGPSDAGSVVVAGADGTPRAELPVLGPAALAFDPRGSTTLAVVAADVAVEDPLGFPLGPLRVVRPDGTTSTLIDDGVVSAWWSPDGSTIAALRLVPSTDPDTAAAGAVRLAVADPAPSVDVHLVFVRVPGGEVRSDRMVQLGRAYVTTILPYFDQYAMSHGVWAPDSSGIVLPLADDDGTNRITVLGADGVDRAIAEGIHATWAP
jgi:hypothetical protein